MAGSQTETAQGSRTSAFVQWLYGLAESDDRGRLAALRRGLTVGEERAYELYRVIPPQFLDDAGPAEALRRMLLAALFAWHPLRFPPGMPAAGPRNVGYSLRLLGERQGASSEGPPEPLRRRMDGLLAAPAADVFSHLQQVVRLLKTEAVPLDWERLLWDLRMWEREDRRVQWEWSRAFYVGPKDEQGGEAHVS